MIRYLSTILFVFQLLGSGVPSAVAEVYLDEKQALDLVLGEQCVTRVREDRLPSSDVKAVLEEQGIEGQNLDLPAHFFVCQRSDGTRTYALIDSEVGKHLPITYIVGISSQGAVTRVEMMVFREVLGWGAKDRAFMQQFEGKAKDDQFRIGQGIRTVSGATISSRSITKGVRRALVLWNHFYGAR